MTFVYLTSYFTTDMEIHRHLHTGEPWKLKVTLNCNYHFKNVPNCLYKSIYYFLFSFLFKKHILVLRTFTYKWIPSCWLCQTAVITFKRCQHDIATLFCQKLDCCLVGLNISDWNTSCDLQPWFSNFSVQKNWGYH